MLWLVIFTPGLLFLIGFFIGLPLNERVSGVKHLQMMTKLSPIMYWATNFIWNYFCYVFVTILTLVTIYILDGYQIFTHFDELCKSSIIGFFPKLNVYKIVIRFSGVLLTLLLIYGWSSIFYAYVYSFFNKTHLSSMLLFITINFIIGRNFFI